MSRTVLIKDDGGKPIPPDPGIKRIPVRIDSRTVILVKEGADIKKRVEKYKNHKYDSPGMEPWAW